MPRISVPGLFLVACSATLPVASALAEDRTPPEREQMGPPSVAAARDKGRFLSVQVENDKFTGTDQHYTNGLRAQWLSAEEDVPGWAMDVARQVPFFSAGGVKRWGVSVGHSIFTPSDTLTRQAQPDDRPYAGWLYGSLGFVAHSGERLNTVELTVGMVGPSAQGRFVQNRWHDIIEVDRAYGWDHQLHDELGVMLAYERKWRAWRKVGSNGFEADLTPHLGVTLGNVMTYGAGGVTVRFGQDLPEDYGPPRIRPSLPGTTYFIPSAGLGWYVFAGIEGRAVLRNIFLDGNTFRDSPSVDKNPLVGDLQAGLAVTWDDYRLAYTHVLRTKEFKGQDDVDRFGSVSLTVRF